MQGVICHGKFIIPLVIYEIVHPITKSLCNHMINIMQELQFIGAIYHLFTVQSMGHTFLSQKNQEYLIKTIIIIKLCFSIMYQFVRWYV
jgi:hypothetical protein